LVFPEGNVVLQGIVEDDFTAISTLAIAGGTGAYINAKGTASREYLNPTACGTAFQSLSLTSDCIVRTQLNLILPTPTQLSSGYTPSNWWWIECGGGNVGVVEDEIAATVRALGNYMPFGCPLYNSTLSNLGEIPDVPTGGRIGYDGGDCNKAYLDKRFDSYVLARQRHLPGFHLAPIPTKSDGFWECPWSSVVKTDGSQILVQGPFADSVFGGAVFAVLGGTGQYFGASGQLDDLLANPSNCISFGFLEASPACSCQYNKTVYLQLPS
jgi:hypothetical protein